MALPRLLSIGADGDLEMRVASVANSLRAKNPSPYATACAALAERTAALKDIHFDNVRGELAWKTKMTGSTFALEDRAGTWWSLACGATRLVREADRQRSFHGFA